MNNFDQKLSQIEESLKDWFKLHRDKRTGKEFKGWINCRTGGPCSSKSKGGKYPACRPTHAQCKTIKNKLHKKKSSARVQWKESVARGNPLPLPEKKETVNSVVKDFFKYAIKKLGIQNVPTVIFNTDKQRVNELRSMAGYMPGENKIWIYTNKRNAADIIRSLAHELVHCKQKESNPDRPINGSTGSEDENEANSVAGILLRTYGKQNPLIYESYQVNENFIISSNLQDLPVTPPYGFWITKDNRFVVVPFQQHDAALETLYPDFLKKFPGFNAYAGLQDYAYKLGVIRMVAEGERYYITYKPGAVSDESVKLAEDIATHYNMQIVDDLKGARLSLRNREKQTRDSISDRLFNRAVRAAIG
jgi:hypothetical protein